MINDLEFELEINRIKDKVIQYDVLRKGICVGILILEKPYNRKGIEKELMIMYNRKENKKC